MLFEFFRDVSSLLQIVWSFEYYVANGFFISHACTRTHLATTQHNVGEVEKERRDHRGTEGGVGQPWKLIFVAERTSGHGVPLHKG